MKCKLNNIILKTEAVCVGVYIKTTYKYSNKNKIEESSFNVRVPQAYHKVIQLFNEQKLRSGQKLLVKNNV